MSLPHKQKCPYCDVVKHYGSTMSDHISFWHGYWAGYKFRVRYNLRRSNWFKLAINTVVTTVIMYSILLLVKEMGLW